MGEARRVASVAIEKGKNGRKLGPTLKTQLFFLNEICTVTHLPDHFGKDTFKKFFRDQDGKKYRIGNAFVASKAARSIPICIRG